MAWGIHEEILHDGEWRQKKKCWFQTGLFMCLHTSLVPLQRNRSNIMVYEGNWNTRHSNNFGCITVVPFFRSVCPDFSRSEAQDLLNILVQALDHHLGGPLLTSLNFYQASAWPIWVLVMVISLLVGLKNTFNTVAQGCTATKTCL